MFGQPCMVIETRYFRLMDMSLLQLPEVSMADIVVEVPHEVYDAGKFSTTPGAFVCARVVAFDTKGKPSANLSV